MLERPDPRRLAALDLHGRYGSLRRRRLVFAEFAGAAVGCTTLAVLLPLSTDPTGAGWVMAVCLLGFGANYAVLTWHALRSSGDRARDADPLPPSAEVAAYELRRYPWSALWLFVPFSLLVPQRRPPA